MPLQAPKLQHHGALLSFLGPSGQDWLARFRMIENSTRKLLEDRGAIFLNLRICEAFPGFAQVLGSVSGWTKLGHQAFLA